LPVLIKLWLLAVAISNEFVLTNLCGYRHKSYIAKNEVLALYFIADSMGLPSTTFA